MGEIQGRYRGNTGEIQGDIDLVVALRLGDTWEIWGRYRGNTGEI